MTMTRYASTIGNGRTHISAHSSRVCLCLRNEVIERSEKPISERKSHSSIDDETYIGCQEKKPRNGLSKLVEREDQPNGSQ